MQPTDSAHRSPRCTPRGERPDETAREASRRLQVGYVVALGLIAALTLGSHAILVSMLSMSRFDAVTLNLAGRQRMLSQRITKEALLAAGDPARRERALLSLREDLDRFESVHRGLRAGDDARGIAGPGREVAGDAFPPLHEAYLAFQDAAEGVLSELDSKTAAASMPALLRSEAVFLPRMDAVVGAYEAWSAGKLRVLRRVHLLAGAILLGVLVLEALLLFRPAVRRIRTQMLALAIAQERNQMLATAAEHTHHAVLLAEADGTIAWVNPAAESAFHACESDVPTLADVTPERVSSQVRAAVAAGADLHVDEVATGASNLALDLVAVRGLGGVPRRYVLVVTDLTKRALRERDRQDVQRRAGRADVAISILHNVGNTLNSLSLAAAAADQTLQQSRLPGLERALGMLDTDPAAAAAFLADDPRGAKLPRYLHDLCRHLHGEQDRLREDLSGVLTGVDHLRHVVSAENASVEATAEAREEAMEDMDAADLIAEAVRLYGGSAGVEGVTIEVDPPPAPCPLRVDRHAALQVLGNLITNAVRSVRERCPAPATPPPIRIGAGFGGTGFGCVRVIDAGVGVEEASLGSLFRAGYTTKAGSDGIGLHASANAATAMGGRLLAASDGPGTGATFTLEVPLASAARRPLRKVAA